jgi:hypothetical protein
LADLEPAGASLYVTSHSCPGQVVAGLCTVQSDFYHAPPLKAYPVTLWRYADGRWEDLGQPGVFSYAAMMRFPGGLLFVSRTHSEERGYRVTGPLRVSSDEGRTWQSWPIPKPHRGCQGDFAGPAEGPCNVAVVGDYVFVTSEFGWIRRSIRSGGWEDVALPKRARLYPFDTGSYGLLALDDGTLVATVNNPDDDGPKGFFRVSKDFGATWSAPRRNPGPHSDVVAVDGSALYAACQGTDQTCSWYRSTDLEHWRKATADEALHLNDGDPVPCRRDYQVEGQSRRLTPHAVQVGTLVYGLSDWAYLRGREATRKELPDIDQAHRIRRVLEQSADSCVTWTPVPSSASS